MNRTILITGGTGLLGVPLAASLSRTGLHVMVQGRSSKRCDITLDLRDRAQVFQALDAIRPEVIVNLVALTDVDKCEQDRPLAFAENVRTVENLADWIEFSGRPTFLTHISTDHVYDGPGEKAERDVTILNTYALTKYCAELAVARVRGTSLRTNFFGKSQVAGRTSFSDWVVRAMSSGDSFRLFSDVYFSPLSISTITRALREVIMRRVPGVYNLGSHDGMSKADFALALGRQKGLSSDLAQIVPVGGLSAARPKDMRMDVGLFEKTFHFDLPTLLDEIRVAGDEYEL